MHEFKLTSLGVISIEWYGSEIRDGSAHRAVWGCNNFLRGRRLELLMVSKSSDRQYCEEG
jgi:hypothetical protein